MMQNMMKKNIRWILLIIVIVLCGYFLWKNNQDFIVSNIEWKCTNRNCMVKFNLENKTRDYLPIKISLRAQKHVQVGNAGAILTNIVGEKKIEYDLKPNEKSDFEELLKVSSGKVDILMVKAWRNKN